MRILSNVIFVACLLVFAIWLVVPFFFAVGGYRFAGAEFRHDFRTTRIWIVPLAVLLTLFKTYKQRDTAEEEGRKFGCTIAIAFGLFLVLFFSYISVGCSDQVLFQKRGAPQAMVLIESCSGGAHDSGPPARSVFKRELVFDWLERIESIDTAHLDRRQWVRGPE